MRALSSRCVTYFDGLRALLAQIVVVGHGFGFFFGYWNGFFPLKAPYIQSVAVTGFFFVSGFLICRSVMANIRYKNSNYARYYADRISRIYCTLIPCLLFVGCVDYLFYSIHPDFDLGNNLSPSILLHNLSLIPSMPFGTMRPIWSLMFEWWIYIVFGGIVFFRKNRVAGAFCICIGAYYTFYINAKGEAGHLEYIWLLGALGAVFFDNATQVKHSKHIALLSISAAIFVYLITLDAYNLIAGTLLSLALIFFAASTNKSNTKANVKVSRSLEFLAGYSFTLFLTHYTVLYWLQKSGFSGLYGLLISWLASNLIALIIARHTEKHHKAVSDKILQLRDIKSKKLT
ncbi:acyltransferase family protein [Pseudomonas sp. LB3P81]